MIGRRGFLKAIGVGVLGLSLALRRPEHALTFKPKPDKNGLSVRFVRQWDAVESRQLHRFDVLYGYGTLNPEFAVRITDQSSVRQRLIRWRWAA